MKKYPFKFLDSYTREDKDIYFGRTEESNQLYEMIFQTNILLVFGPVGTGKTSLIQCGLAQRFETHDWLELPVRRSTELNDTLKAILDKAVKDASGEEFVYDSELNESAILARLFKTIYLNTFKPIYLVFDQFEELYILGSKEEEKKFISIVKEILKIEYPIKMIFCIREEYLGFLADFEKEVPELFRKKIRVESMGFPKVEEVLMNATAAENSNLKLKEGEERAICEAIFTILKGKDRTLTIQLPYLQVFLDKLYNEVTHNEEHLAGATFTLEAVQNIGDLGDVLRDFLETQVQKISQSDLELTERDIWMILSPFATLEGTKDPICLPYLYERFPGFSKDLLKQTILSFVDKKILRYQEESELYEIVHDSIAQKIAEKRSEDEIALLEVRRLIKSQASINEKVREYFTANQLSFIGPFQERLIEHGLIDDVEYRLIEESKNIIALEKIRDAEKQKEALESAELRAKTERRLREQEEQAKLSAIQAKNLAQRLLRITFSIAVVVIIISGIAVFYYFQANREKSINTLERHLNAARKLKASGDEYMRIGKKEEACDSYRKGLDTLKGLTDEPLYLEMQKLQNICK